MNTYIIRYRFHKSQDKYIVVSTTINLLNDAIALKVARKFEKEGNFIESVVNKDSNKELYHYKDSNLHKKLPIN